MKKLRILAPIAMALALGIVGVATSCSGTNTPEEQAPSGESGDKVAVKNVILDKTALTLIEGETGKITVSFSPANATNKNVTWTSSDPSIATVDQEGNVTAIKAGTTSIVVKSEDGNKRAACTVTVEEPLPEATETINLVFHECFGQTIKDNLNEKLEDFRKAVLRHDKVDVKVSLADSSSYTSLESDIKADLKIGQIPNLLVAYPDHVANYMAYEEDSKEPGKYIVELSELANDEEFGFGKEDWLLDDTTYTGFEDFIPSYVKEGQQFTREGTYVLPFMKSTEAMYYNLDRLQVVFKEWKPSVSTIPAIKEYMQSITWDDFMSLCNKAVQIGAREDQPLGVKFTNAAFYDSDSNLFITGLFQKGIPFSSVDTKNGTGSIDFQEGEAREKADAWLESLYQACKSGALTTKGVDGTYGSNSFKEEKSIFSIGSTGGAGYNMTTEFNIGVCKVPTMGENHVYVSQGPSLAIMKDPKKTDAQNAKEIKYTFRLLKYLTNTDVNTFMCVKGSEGYLPVRESAYTCERFLRWQSGGGYLVDTANVTIEDIDNQFLSTACFRGSSELRTQVGGMLASYVTNKVSSAHDAVEAAIENTILKMGIKQ